MIFYWHRFNMFGSLLFQISLSLSSSLLSEANTEKYKDLRALLQLLSHLCSKDLVCYLSWHRFYLFSLILSSGCNFISNAEIAGWFFVRFCWDTSHKYISGIWHYISVNIKYEKSFNIANGIHCHWVFISHKLPCHRCVYVGGTRSLRVFMGICDRSKYISNR